MRTEAEKAVKNMRTQKIKTLTSTSTRTLGGNIIDGTPHNKINSTNTIEGSPWVDY